MIGLPAKRQWCYETFGSIFMLDDDCTGFKRLWLPRKGRLPTNAPPEVVREAILEAGSVAQQMGVFLFGFQSHVNATVHDPHRPFKFGGYSPGGAIGLLAGSKLWWPKDTTLPIDDYWICALNAYHHRRGWYDGRFAFGFAETYIGQGGMAEYRVNEGEKLASEYLIKWFGPLFVPKRPYNKGGPKGMTKVQRNEHARSLAIPWRH